MVARSSLCPFERRAWNDVPLGANVLSLYQLELIKEGYHMHCKNSRSVESMSNQVKTRTVSTSALVKEGKHNFQTFTTAQIKDRNVNISKGKTKDGSRAQVNWNEKFQAFVKFEGMPTAQTSVIGD